MRIKGQGHFFTIYFQVLYVFVLYLTKISGERLQGHWSSGIGLLILDMINRFMLGHELHIYYLTTGPAASCSCSCWNKLAV